MIIENLRQTRDGLQQIAQAAYEVQDWDGYEFYTDEYMRLEDDSCSCPIRLNVKVSSCPFHGDLAETGTLPPVSNPVVENGDRKTLSTDWGYIYFVRDGETWKVESYLVIDDRVGRNEKVYIDGRPSEVATYEPE